VKDDETHQRIHQIKNAIIKKRRRLFVEKQAHPRRPETPCRSYPICVYTLLARRCRYMLVVPHVDVSHKQRTLHPLVTRSSASVLSRLFAPQPLPWTRTWRLGSYPEKKCYRSFAPAASTRGLNYETLRNRSIPLPLPPSLSLLRWRGFSSWRRQGGGPMKSVALTLHPEPGASLHQPSMHSRRCISLRFPAWCTGSPQGLRPCFGIIVVQPVAFLANENAHFRVDELANVLSKSEARASSLYAGSYVVATPT